MYLLLFIVLLLALLIYSLFEKLSVLTFQLDTDKSDVHLTFSWLYPFITAQVRMMNSAPYLDIYLLKAHIYSKKIKKQKKKSNYQFNLQSINYKDAYANIYYGLENPFATSVTSGILAIFHQYASQVSTRLYPDFIPAHEYVMIDAGAKLNIGKTLMGFLRSNKNK